MVKHDSQLVVVGFWYDHTTQLYPSAVKLKF